MAAPFPIEPADVPGDAVRAVRYTALRHPGLDLWDEDDARLIAAVVFAWLADNGAADAVAVPVPACAEATGDVVAD